MLFSFVAYSLTLLFQGFWLTSPVISDYYTR
jgi:hypothetical protein